MTWRLDWSSDVCSSDLQLSPTPTSAIKGTSRVAMLHINSGSSLTNTSTSSAAASNTNSSCTCITMRLRILLSVSHCRSEERRVGKDQKAAVATELQHTE